MSGIMLNIVGATYGGGALAIGDPYQGGFYAGQISTAGTGVANFNLVIGPVASAASQLQWKTSNSGSDPTSVINGPANSSAMNSTTYPAAYFCEGLTVGGYTDWYLPAKNELEICYYNLKPTTASNSGSGINANAVPARASPYTSGTPAQTSAAAFVTGTGAEAFTASGTGYWSSTQYSGSYANFQIFTTGSQSYGSKTFSLFTRAVRRVAV